jgi:anaerobic magnesium-protoporphyrin IX monomethyl ester cyclase
MRIVLLYPPPWKIPVPRDTADFGKDGPPRDYGKAMISGGDSDFYLTPYGLLSLGAQALRAGHEVVTLNISKFSWCDIELLIRHLHAEVFGISFHVLNRRGAAGLAQLIRELHPAAHIVGGGPFPSALPVETLKHYQAFDTVVIGEGEATFLELLGRLEKGESAAGLAGAAWRANRDVQMGPPRSRLRNLDVLASPLDYFPTSVLVTSRGCPGNCTFCGSKAMWGKLVTFHSVDYVLKMIDQAINQHGIRYIAFKDDTFTADRQRIKALCRGILQRRRSFIWSCDTRVDSLDEETLHLMRLAGCQRLSLGVESASPIILKNLKKRISPGMIQKVTRLAKKYGFQLRYYLIAGSRGETLETFRETLDFIEETQPHEVDIGPLEIYPGTEEFAIFKEQGGDAEIFFKEDFCSFAKLPETPPDDQRLLKLIEEKSGNRNRANYTIEELEAILALLPDHPAAHVDLAGAYYRQGRYDEVEKHLRLALELNYCSPGLVYNYLACLAAARQEIAEVMEYLIKAYKYFPHEIIQQNLKLLARWHKEGGPQNGRPLRLKAHNLFERNVIVQQPEAPGSIKLNIRQTGETFLLGAYDSLEYHQREPLNILC